MSEGPIRSWRDAWKPPTVSTTNTDRVCHTTTPGRGYCGRRNNHTTDRWDKTTCADCRSAARADGKDIT